MTHKEKVGALIEHVKDKLPLFFKEGNYPVVVISKKEYGVVGIEKHGTVYRAILDKGMCLPLMASEDVCDAINAEVKVW